MDIMPITTTTSIATTTMTSGQGPTHGSLGWTRSPNPTLTQILILDLIPIRALLPRSPKPPLQAWGMACLGPA